MEAIIHYDIKTLITLKASHEGFSLSLKKLDESLISSPSGVSWIYMSTLCNPTNHQNLTPCKILKSWQHSQLITSQQVAMSD